MSSGPHWLKRRLIKTLLLSLQNQRTKLMQVPEKLRAHRMSHKGEEWMLGERGGGGNTSPLKTSASSRPSWCIHSTTLKLALSWYFFKKFWFLFISTLLYILYIILRPSKDSFLNNTKCSKENNRKCLEIMEEILLCAPETAKLLVKNLNYLKNYWIVAVTFFPPFLSNVGDFLEDCCQF